MDLDDIEMNYDPSFYQQAVDEFVRQMEAGDDYSSDSGSDAGMSSSGSSVDSFDELIEQFDGLPNEVVAEFVKTCCAGCLPEDGKQIPQDVSSLLVSSCLDYGAHCCSLHSSTSKLSSSQYLPSLSQLLPATWQPPSQ